MLYKNNLSFERINMGTMLGLSIAYLILLAPLINLHGPYYHYIDEGHVVLWGNALTSDMSLPSHIFYGPTIFYLQSIIGAGASLVGVDLFADSSTPLFYNDINPALLMSMRWISLLATIAAAWLFTYAIPVKHHAARILCFSLILTTPFYADKAIIAQVEPLALILTGWLVYLARNLDADTPIKQLVLPCICAILLTGIKPFYAIFLGFIALYAYPAFSLSPEKRYKALINAIGISIVLLIVSALYYLSLRSFEQWQDTIAFALNSYNAKSTIQGTHTTLIAQMADGTLLHWLNILAIASLFIWCNIRSQRLHTRVFMTLALIMLVYFLTKTWPVTRNIFILPAVFLWAASLQWTTEHKEWQRRLYVLSVFVSMLCILLFSYSRDWHDHTLDFRTVFIENYAISNECSDVPLYIDARTQIHRSHFMIDATTYISEGKMLTTYDNAAKGSCFLLTSISHQMLVAKSYQLKAQYEIKDAIAPMPTDYIKYPFSLYWVVKK